VPGQFLVFYSRPNDKGKVLGSGFMEIAGVFTDGEFNTLPLYQKDENEETVAKPKVADKIQF